MHLAKGVDADGEVRDFYAVTYNQVVIPEYVINERGEYPTDPETARQRFQQRKPALESKMKARYILPNNALFFSKQFLLYAGFTVVSPVTYPLYAMSAKEGKRSLGEYYRVMSGDNLAKPPVLRDEFANFP